MRASSNRPSDEEDTIQCAVGVSEIVADLETLGQAAGGVESEAAVRPREQLQDLEGRTDPFQLFGFVRDLKLPRSRLKRYAG